MMQKRNLYIELLDQNNRYLDDQSSFDLVKIYTKLLYTIMIFALSIGVILALLNIFFILTNSLSFIDLISLIIGYPCLMSAFKMIKDKTIPYLYNNPIFISGIFLSAFFNAGIVQMAFNLIGINFNIRLIVLVLSVILNYFLLAKSYQKHNKQE